MQVPPYKALPLSPSLGLPCAWEIFGPNDALGTLTFLKPETISSAIDFIRTGKRIPLSLPLTEPSPGMFWRSPAEHEVIEVDRNTLDDRFLSLYPQASSHWDAFSHVRAGLDGYYGGITELEAAKARLGIDHWNAGIIGRGVLIDVSELTMRNPSDFPDVEVTVEDLKHALNEQSVQLTQGSILCLRTGWIDHFLTLSNDERIKVSKAGKFPGLRADLRMSEFLWDNGISAIVSDNPAVEVAPGDRNVGSLHRQSMVMTGLPFGELFSLHKLSVHCRAQSTWDFMFVSVPMNVPNGVGSPANAVAIV